MLFNSLEFLLFVLLCDSTSDPVSVLACVQLFLLYVLESAVCIADADVDGDHVCIRAAAGKGETEQRGEAAKTKDALVCGALIYQ